MQSAEWNKRKGPKRRMKDRQRERERREKAVNWYLKMATRIGQTSINVWKHWENKNYTALAASGLQNYNYWKSYLVCVCVRVQHMSGSIQWHKHIYKYTIYIFTNTNPNTQAILLLYRQWIFSRWIYYGTLIW